MNNGKLPFIFARLTHKSQEEINHSGNAVIKDWLVKIAKHIDFITYKCEWMCDEELGNVCLVPDVDISESDHVFPTYEEARAFVKQWWIDN